MELYFNPNTNLHYRTRIGGTWTFRDANRVTEDSWMTTVDDNTRPYDYIYYEPDTKTQLFVRAGDAYNAKALNKMNENELNHTKEIAPSIYEEITGQNQTTKTITLGTIIAIILIILVLKKLLKKKKK